MIRDDGAPRIGVFLVAYTVFAFTYGAFVIWARQRFGYGFLDETLTLLFPPAYYAAFRYENRTYLQVSAVAFFSCFWVIYQSVSHLQSSMETLVVFSFVTVLTFEVTYRTVRKWRSTATALQEAHDELERRVEERTMELAATNRSLEEEVAERRKTEESLRRNQGKERRFQEQLRALHEVSNELSTIQSFYELCRQAIVLGRERLGFDRLGIWFIDAANPNRIIGTFGTDPSGNVCDERAQSGPHKDVSGLKEFLTGQKRAILKQDHPLSFEHKVVGQGDLAVAGMWDGRRIVGYFIADNLIRGEPIADDRCEILTLYAVTVGHLCSLRKEAEERSHLEEQLRQSRRLESLGMLAGGIAHEFNNLLTGILGNLVLAQRPDPKKSPQRLAGAEKAARRAAELVQQLLAFSRKSKVAVKAVQLEKIVDEVLGIIGSTFDRRIDVQVQQTPGLPPVMADPSQIHQVLLNLALNARDAILATSWPTRGGEPGARITIQTDEELDSGFLADFPDARAGDFVRIRVSDTGIGMDGRTRDHAFDPFFTTKEAGKGTGLGLAMVYGIVKQHEGHVLLNSEMGEGTTVTVYLPVAHESSGTVEDEPLDTPPEEQQGHETILIVDDEEMILEMGAAALTPLGYRVLTAHGGAEAMDVLGRDGNEIALVVLDWAMPEIQGEEVLGRIRAQNTNTQILLTSGHHWEQLREEIGADGHSDFLAKPYGPAELTGKVREMLNRNALAD